MTTTERIWITPQAHSRLRAELNELRTRLDGPGSTQIGSRAEDGGVERSAVHARIRRIHDLLRHAVVGEVPPDDGVAEPGMVLTVRYDDTGDTETFLLAVRDAEHGDTEVYSTDSPLGTAILGASPGQQRTYAVPSGATVRVTLLNAVPYGHEPDHETPQSQLAGSGR